MLLLASALRASFDGGSPASRASFHASSAFVVPRPFLIIPCLPPPQDTNVPASSIAPLRAAAKAAGVELILGRR